jgi:ABC-type amino acid transport substrate-binding protein
MMNKVIYASGIKSAALVISLLLANSVYSRELNIAHSADTTTYGNYPKELLALALSYSATDYSLKSAASVIPYERSVNRVGAGKLDVIWTDASSRNEKRMLPIHIPIFKGLLGYRIFIINKGSQSKFDLIHSEKNLKSLRLGQVAFWADSQILELNGYSVKKVQRYDDVLPMLVSKRFDAFPRGIFEPWVEIENNQQFDLEVEKTLMLKYPMPMYYYVNENQKELADDIEQGLERVIANGEFDKFFYANKQIQNILEKSNFENRRVFELKNPSLPQSTPLKRSELWLTTTKEPR